MEMPPENSRERWQIPTQYSSCHPWQKLYRAAILETDRSTLENKISAAELAIAKRRGELARETGQYAQVEREAMDDALYALRALRSAQTADLVA